MPPTVTVRNLSDHTFKECTLGEVGALVKGPGLVWVDVLDPDQATMDAVAKQVDIPPLAIEDMLEEQTRPKIDLYPDLLFFVWVVGAPEDPDHPVRTLDFNDVSFVVQDHLVVTTRRAAVVAIDDLHADKIHLASASPAWLVHTILDRSTDDLLDAVDEASDKLDDLENQVMETADPGQLQTLYKIKRQLLTLRKIVQGERDVVREIARAESWVGQESYMYYQDVGDHLARIADEVDTYFDVATGIMDIYLSAQNNRMNEIMKQLTVVATIFMPLTLMSGIYGMNLIPGMWPRPVYDPWGFAAVCATMLAIAVAMLWWFRRKKWW